MAISCVEFPLPCVVVNAGNTLTHLTVDRKDSIRQNVITFYDSRSHIQM